MFIFDKNILFQKIWGYEQTEHKVGFNFPSELSF